MTRPDLRQHPRQPRIESLHIQVMREAEHERDPGLVLHVKTRDISRDGFSAHANRELQSGRIFDVLVELNDNHHPFLLTSEVRWCKPLGNNEFLVGFSLLPAQHSDIDAWHKLFL